MKVIITGEEGHTIYGNQILELMKRGSLLPTEIVTQEGSSVSDAAEEFARFVGWSVNRFKTHRVPQMARYADAMIAIWNGRGGKTRDIILSMRRQNKPVVIQKVEP